MPNTPKITPFLTYDDQAEEAASFYVSLIPNSKISQVRRFGDAPPPHDRAMVVTFELDGREYVALNGGPHFKFTDGFSLAVECDTQEEVDRYWEALSEGGEEGPCGWLKDRFGVSWQVNPRVLHQMLADPDRVKAGRVMDAMLKMKKFSIPELQAAYDAR